MSKEWWTQGYPVLQWVGLELTANGSRKVVVTQDESIESTVSLRIKFLWNSSAKIISPEIKFFHGCQKPNF